jgi:hypothetical protein
VDDGVAGTDEQKRIAVRGRIHDRLGADSGAGSWPVLDQEWLAKPIGQPSTDQTCENVGRAASGRRDDDAHGLHWVGLRPCYARTDRESSGTRCQMQKLTTRESI